MLAIITRMMIEYYDSLNNDINKKILNDNF
jgi:hypothetical protein